MDRARRQIAVVVGVVVVQVDVKQPVAALAKHVNQFLTSIDGVARVEQHSNICKLELVEQTARGIGAADNLASMVLEAHPDFELWNSHRLAGSGLFVSYCLLRYESAAYREAMQADLMAQYVSAADAMRYAREAIAQARAEQERQRK